MTMQHCVQAKQAIGRTVAFFPGAFRPPHAAHFAAVLDLAQRPEVEEVMIVIANRNRTLPGTTVVFEARLVSQIWHQFLAATDLYPALTKVHTTIAEHSAIQQAFDYLEEAQPGDTLYFCIGESDLAKGDPRFANLAAIAAQRGVCARIIPAPTGHLAIRATDLRRAIARGTAGQTDFFAALPAHLSDTQRHAIWHACHDGLREISSITQEKVERILREATITETPNLRPLQQGKVDPVFRLQQPSGDRLYVKYAGDTVGDGRVGDRLQPKPRRRLGTERRALTYLHKALAQTTVALPEIIHFDKVTRTLVLTEVCPGGISLETELAHGRFDVAVAGMLGTLLATLHQPTAALRPFWGEVGDDLVHWQTMLAWRTATSNCPTGAATNAARLTDLQQESDGARRPGFFHLDLVPKNILLTYSKDERERGRGHRMQLGIIDMELCANVGDPAYELGLLIAHYRFWGTAANQPVACQNAVQALIDAYLSLAADDDPHLLARTTAFAGAGLFGLLTTGPSITDAIHRDLLAIATTLLQNSLGQSN